MRDFILTCGVGIGFAVTFFMFGLDIFHSLPDFIKGLSVLAGFTLIMILLKLVFRWMDMNDVIDGVQMGIVVRCWAPIFSLHWHDDFWFALKVAGIYFVFGMVILLIGYFLSRQRRKKK
jgi:hypothetical protein